ARAGSDRRRDRSRRGRDAGLPSLRRLCTVAVHFRLKKPSTSSWRDRRAHADYLGAASVTDALKAIAEDIASVSFAPSRPRRGRQFGGGTTATGRLPTVAPKVRAGLSRNGRVAAGLRLWVIDARSTTSRRGWAA
ncbi:MAG: hypothetical protein ACREV8_09620, partial [Gammaproteobacteria bacterium]